MLYQLAHADIKRGPKHDMTSVLVYDDMNRTFSLEHNTSGKRSFLVSTYEGFWLRYRDMLPDHRHYYEIIQESYPCHLYFGVQPCLLIDLLDTIVS